MAQLYKPMPQGPNENKDRYLQIIQIKISQDHNKRSPRKEDHEPASPETKPVVRLLLSPFKDHRTEGRRKENKTIPSAKAGMIIPTNYGNRG